MAAEAVMLDRKELSTTAHQRNEKTVHVHRTNGVDDSEADQTKISGSLLRRLHIDLRSQNNACGRHYHRKFQDHDIANKQQQTHQSKQ